MTLDTDQPRHPRPLVCSDEARARAARVRDAPWFRALEEEVRAEDARTLQDQVELTEIPAPPFQEAARAARMAELLSEAGVAQVTLDEEGNVLGRMDAGGGSTAGTLPPETRQGSAAYDPRETAGARSPVLLTAHLDTVFPEGTYVRVMRDGDTLRGPGISDDGRGLAALLAVCRVLARRPGLLPYPVLIAATVGEEGPGNLRGARHLFRDGGPGRMARAFISLDGAGLRGVVHEGLGSRRLRVEITGPGGHSWSDWGRPNPVHALARAVAALDGRPLAPGTTRSVGRVGGGTSVNAIPQESWAEVEVRGADEEALQAMEADLRAAFSHAVEAVNAEAAPGSALLELGVQPMGVRPAGSTPGDAPLVQAAAAATVALGVNPEAVLSSTDANVAMALGVPAVTLGAGGEAGSAHTTDEWYRNDGGPEGIVRALLTLVVLGELESG